ncbi:MAG: V-type ATP synthase subunit D [Simkaniaceae bacterium]
MSRIKLTKSELRSQQYKFTQLNKYLPTLQLKKSMLQSEINALSLEIENLVLLYQKEEDYVSEFALLLSGDDLSELFESIQIEQVFLDKDNIAGVEFPSFKGAEFKKINYSLFTTPYWWDRAIESIQELLIAREKVRVAEEKKKALEKELREVSIRVNLFEKILIPRSLANIKKIKIFMGDQELASVAQAKAAKKKIMEKRG